MKTIDQRLYNEIEVKLTNTILGGDKIVRLLQKKKPITGGSDIQCIFIRKESIADLINGILSESGISISDTIRRLYPQYSDADVQAVADIIGNVLNEMGK